MKYLKSKTLSSFSATDNNLAINPYGRVVIDATGGLMLPKGTTAQRPQLTGVRQPGTAAGTIRYNTSTSSIEAYVGTSGSEVWEIVRAPGATAITKQTLGPATSGQTIIGPLSQNPPSADNIIVLVENVFQISQTNFNILPNYQGSGNTFLQFLSALPEGKNVTVYFGFAN